MTTAAADGFTESTRRLTTLISRVAYTDQGKCGLRGSSPVLSEDLGVFAEEMCQYYRGAVKYLQDQSGTRSRSDFDELADFTLRFVTHADHTAEQLLGEILIDTLGTLRHVNARVLGRKWLDDVFDLCWNIKLASAPEQYGLER